MDMLRIHTAMLTCTVVIEVEVEAREVAGIEAPEVEEDIIEDIEMKDQDVHLGVKGVKTLLIMS